MKCFKKKMVEDSNAVYVPCGNCSSFFNTKISYAQNEDERLYIQRNFSAIEESQFIPESYSIAFSDPLVAAKAVGLGLMMLFTILGNLLVIVSVLPNPTLRTPTHSLIVNLAIADLLLGMTVLPLSSARELAEGIWLLGPDLCSIWTTLDVLCCTASILSLCGISVDRYVGVSKPLSYSRIMTKRRVHCSIAVIWALALTISVAQLLGTTLSANEVMSVSLRSLTAGRLVMQPGNNAPRGWKEESPKAQKQTDECHVNKNLGYVIFSACGSFYIPALVIIVLYTLVYKAAVKHSEFMESGMKTTGSHVTLRVHMGSNKKGENLEDAIFEKHI